MMVTTKVIVAFYFSVALIRRQVNSLNILGVCPFQGHSHFTVSEKYLKVLAQRGHNVTVISHFPQNQTVENYHDINLAEKQPIFEDDFPTKSSYWNTVKMISFIVNVGTNNCKVMLNNEKVQELWKTKAKFDVIIVEQFNSDCALGLAHVLEAPMVGLTTHALMPWHYSRFGVPQNPSYVSNVFLNGGTKPTLLQRLERIIFDIYFKAYYKFFSQRVDQNTLAQYFDGLPHLEELARNIKFLLHYTNFMYSGTNIFSQNIIEVGGYHVMKAEKLPYNLRKFVEEAEHGVVYISFGSVIKSSSLPNDKVEAILGAIKKLPQRFIWKYHNKTLLLDKNKLYVENWLPQVDILGHPNTMAFISHAGMASTTEALSFGVPVVAMPILGDQPSNAAAIEESGMGVVVDSWDFTTDNLVTALDKVTDPQFRANVKLLSKAWHDRPMSPMDTAIYWTEYAARYSNFTFRSPAADVPWYQYAYLDIAIVCLAAITLLFIAFKALQLYHWERKNKVIMIKRRN